MDTRESKSLRVAIVGGGASGASVAVHLAARSADLQVDIYEPAEELGLGIAYSTTDEQHLLNVPAKGMSVFRDDMCHFQRWAGVDPDDFVPRARYGAYLQDCLQAELRDGHLTHIRETIIDVEPSSAGGWLLTDGSAGNHHADVVVLATGHQVPGPPPGIDHEVIGAPGFHVDPWSPDTLAGIEPGERVLCLGTGLTFIDVALSALAAARDVEVTGLSRRGQLPTRHLTPLTAPGEPMELPEDGPIALQSVIEHIRAAGPNWRAAVDGLREQTPQIWQRLSDDDRTTYMRGLSREWDVLRHRMAPDIAEVLHHYRGSGQLRVVGAEDYEISVDGAGFDVHAGDAQFNAERVIVCTGPRADVRLTVLGANLVDKGLASSGPFDIGFDVDPVTGEIAPDLYAIGPLRRGVLFESTAMPEIAAQAQQLAELIAASLVHR